MERNCLPASGPLAFADAGKGTADRPDLLRRHQPGGLHAWRDQGNLEGDARQPGLRARRAPVRRHRGGLCRAAGDDRGGARPAAARDDRHRRGSERGRHQQRIPGAGDLFRPVAGAADRPVAGMRRCRHAARSRGAAVVRCRQVLGAADRALPALAPRQRGERQRRAGNPRRSARQAFAPDPLALVRAAVQRHRPVAHDLRGAGRDGARARQRSAAARRPPPRPLRDRHRLSRPSGDASAEQSPAGAGKRASPADRLSRLHPRAGGRGAGLSARTRLRGARNRQLPRRLPAPPDRRDRPVGARAGRCLADAGDVPQADHAAPLAEPGAGPGRADRRRGAGQRAVRRCDGGAARPAGAPRGGPPLRLCRSAPRSGRRPA